MKYDVLFFAQSALLGLGLAMDAFSVSLADGLHEPDMKKGKACLVAGTFGLFQFAMPMIGWLLVHTMVEQFKAFEKAIPYIALVLLCFIGGKMIYDGIKNGAEDDTKEVKTGILGLLIQGVATSIDALSVGFTIGEYDVFMALTASAVIAAVTFGVCVAGVFIGRKFGLKFREKATIAGGIILVVIGIEIFVRGILGV